MLNSKKVILTLFLKLKAMYEGTNLERGGQEVDHGDKGFY